jgi:8-amino-3,8-dideoxy-alpha-D-manno-octulosonate transaminase
LHPELKARVMQEANKNFAASDAIMSRCVSTAISLLWTEEQIKEKGEKMVNVIRKVLNEQKALA